MTISEELAPLIERLSEIDGREEFYKEELDRMKSQVDALTAEDRGWTALFGSHIDEDDGLTLETLKKGSRLLKEDVAGSPLPKQANALRLSYTFATQFIIPSLDGSVETPTQGAPTKAATALKGMRAFYNKTANQRYVFGVNAHQLMSTACSTDGAYFLVGDDSTKTLRPVPISEIEGASVNPEFPSEVWAYLRSWTPVPGKDATKKWYYTDTFDGTRQKNISNPDPNGQPIPVAADRTILDFKVNQQVGWIWGIPDLWAGQVWNRNYITMMNHGKEVSEVLAFYAAKIKQKSKTGSASTGVKIANAGKGVGKTLTHGEGNDIDVFSSAGKTYDFAGLNPVAGLYASAAGVSLVDLLSSPSASGSSYGAAKALDGGARRAIELRREQIAEWFERIILWGSGVTIKVTPASIEEVDPYRKAQILVLGWNTGAFHTDEVRPEMLYMAGITPKHDKAPEGIMLPNNENSLPRKDVDTDSTTPASTAPAGSSTPPTTAAPGQGQSTGNGGAGSTAANDGRTDQITK